ncbi:MAG TPA: adenylyltransferase/cytidyltransferase family protein, partial [Pseudomonadales bacterium]|nr:adenylyltransferase/cytidyltransferase family protein [Pseudomonadales bacterium]
MRTKKRLGVYAGSFDPLTIGHLWMIEQGATLFDSLTVAVGINPDKRYTFTLEDRLDMLRESL